MNGLPISGESSTTTAANRTGLWRSVEPFYLERTAPCAASCLAGEDIPLQVELVFEKRPDEALAVLRLANPFPAITGRVCPAPCENSCLRQTLGGSVSIRGIERSLGDHALGRQIAPSPRAKLDRQVAVVGAGPAGLAAAFYLGLEGYRVTVFDEKPKAGGLLRYGIPPFRLPREILDAELELAFRNLSVEFRFGSRVTDKNRTALGEFDALLLAAGRNAASDPKVPGASPEMSGLRLLEAVGHGQTPPLSGTVAVVGGGSTAFDCARVARRLGAQPTIYYRRTRDQMPAFAHDLQEADEEGIPIVECASPVRVRDRRLALIRTQSESRSAPVKILSGTAFEVEADHVLFATGETQEALFPDLQGESGGMPVDEGFLTRGRGFFAAGDFTTQAPGTVSGAILQGRLAAASVHRFLSGAGAPAPRGLSAARGVSGEVVRLEDLNLNYAVEARRPPPRRRTDPGRTGDFREIDSGLGPRAVAHEAGRCLSCGTCVFCFNCLNFCADGAVRFDAAAQRFSIDLEHCKGCLVCVAECPRHCMGSRYAEAGTPDR